MTVEINLNEPIYIKSAWVIRQPLFIKELAGFYRALNMSGDETIDWIHDLLYFRESYPIYDCKGKLVNIETVFIEDIFGKDQRRCINSLKQWAKKAPSQRLQKRCVKRAKWLDVVRQKAILMGV